MALTGRLSAMESSTGTLGTLKEGRERSSKEGMDVLEVSATDDCAMGSAMDSPAADVSAVDISAKDGTTVDVSAKNGTAVDVSVKDSAALESASKS